VPTISASILGSELGSQPAPMLKSELVTLPTPTIDHLLIGLQQLQLSNNPAVFLTSNTFISTFSTSISVANIVLVPLNKIDNYLNWCTRFTAILISCNLFNSLMDLWHNLRIALDSTSH